MISLSQNDLFVINILYIFIQLEEMYKKCHANIRANPDPEPKKERKDVKVKR